MSKAKIMIVEDEVIVAEDIRDMVEDLDYDVTAIARSGEAALKKAEETKPDLILMDIVLKGEMDGVEAADQIRNRFDIPVVYLTAHAQDEIVERAKVTEPFGYLLKPFEERELHSVIEIALYKHKLDKALRESEERYRTFFDNLSVGVAMIDPGGNLLAANKVLSSTLGYTQEELAGAHISRFMHSEDLGNYLRLYESLTNGERDHFLMTCRHVRKDGEIVWVRVYVSGIRNPEGKSKYATSISENITEYKRVKEALLTKETELAGVINELKRVVDDLKKSEQKYREIAEFLPDVIFKEFLMDA